VDLEKDGEVTDGEGTRHVDQERADGKIAMIVLADHTPGQPAQQ
jgi:alpha-D-ribose 1-methylphosphonate 5-triphosphate diphosphatase PhnM